MCRDEWDINAAGVLCSQLNFSYEGIYIHMITVLLHELKLYTILDVIVIDGPSNGAQAFQIQVMCDGSEQNLTACTRNIQNNMCASAATSCKKSSSKGILDSCTTSQHPTTPISERNVYANINQQYRSTKMC